ncbi:hypothetical protein ACPV5U_18535 [Vibrio mediterranei]
MRTLRQQTRIERMSDEEFAQLVAEPNYITKGDVWFPERLEAKGMKRELERLQQKTDRKKHEIDLIREVSNGTIKAET